MSTGRRRGMEGVKEAEEEIAHVPQSRDCAYARIGRKGWEPYFVPHARDFEGRPQSAGRPLRADVKVRMV